MPFLLVHAGVLGLLFVGWSPVALVVCVLSYAARMLGITVFYHRGFAHRAFSMPRPVQALGAALGAAAAQRGPLWWVAHHRVHHRFTDRSGDPHSPVVSGFWRSHVGWLFDTRLATDRTTVADLEQFRELRVLDRYHHLAPISTAAGVFVLGTVLHWLDPGLGTSGPQLLVWGFFVSTTALYHSTFCVNSVAHRFGRRRFETKDASRNNFVVALLTMGEGWHNNHHRYPASARQGLARHEIDPAWLVIRAMAALRLAGDLRPVPARVWAEAGLAPARSQRG